MQPEKRKALGPARIVALALICIGALALAYLRVSPGSDSVTVPSGAYAGQLTLHPCRYATEDGSLRADCGTLVVPENRHRAGTRLIGLPVTRIRARSATRGMPIFRLQGGPGITNMSFADASRFAGRHDVVLVGYRGVDGSSKLDCPEVVSAREHARDLLSERSYRAVAAGFRSCAQRLQRSGVDLAGYTLPERVDDLDTARRALGYRRIDLVSESAGTRTALIYAWRYPKRIHRSVLIGANPPGAFLWDARTTGEQVRRYAALCSRDASCRARTPDLAAALHTGFSRMPKRWWFLPIKRGNAKAAAFFGLMNATTDGGGPLSAPRTLDTLVRASRGDGSGAWLLSVLAQLAFPRAQVWGDAAAVARADAAYARRFFAAHADRGSVIGSPGTDLVWAGGRLLGSWPSSPDEHDYTRVRNSEVETLVLGGALDFATPPQNAARALLPHLANGRQIVLPSLGHTDDFWSYEPAASTRLVSTFLDSGRVDTSLYTANRVDFTPSFNHAWIAEIVVAVLIGLAALTVVSLACLAGSVHRRGRLARKRSAAVRAVYAPLLGLGGWCAAALVALTAFPTIPLDEELLAAASVGAAVAGGVFFAWVHRGWSASTKATGLAAAAGGALVGAWLGFNAIDGLFAVITAVLGATVGANLTLLGLDVAWDRQARDRSAPIRDGAQDRPGAGAAAEMGSR